ncbi:MAG: ABC transporter permease [Thermoplasmata archaeon]|nr:ABC transporter permease [Thermoplasmata archaeon]
MSRFISTVKTAMWLDYQIASNWTKPLTFFTYNIAKPVGASLLLLAMYYVVTGKIVGSMALSFIYIGNAFYMILGQVMMDLGWLVHEDREHYQTLKYIMISPSSYYSYLIGRSAARFLLSIFPAIFLLLLGFIIHIPYNFNYPLLLFTILFGWIFMVSAGMLLNTITLLTARYGGSIGETFAGIFYLLSGVIFPLSVLPSFLTKFALFLPSTYWFSLIRRSVLGMETDPVLSQLSLQSTLILFAITTAYFITLSLSFYFSMDYLARRRGALEMITTY